MRAPPPARSGFTLIEVMAALVVFSIGVLLTVGLTTQLSRQMQRASLRSEIVVIAQQLMDSLMHTPYDSLVVLSTSGTVQIQGRQYVQTVHVQQIDLMREVTVSLVPETPPGPDYQLVTFVPRPW